MTDKQIIIDGKIIGCPCYIDRPLHRYDKGCLVQSQAFKEQQTEEKPILRCDEIKNCPIKENFKQLQRKTAECEQKDKVIKGLHLIIDRLLEASGYDKHISSAEDFEYVYKDMDYKLGLIDELKQECEELKERLVRTEEDLKYQCVDCMNVKSDRYRKALEEIEEIAKSFNKNELCFYKEINECDCCDMGADCNYLRRAKILYIINKAKEKSDG